MERILKIKLSWGKVLIGFCGPDSNLLQVMNRVMAVIGYFIYKSNNNAKRKQIAMNLESISKNCKNELQFMYDYSGICKIKQEPRTLIKVLLDKW